jgi:Fic family protein
MSGGEVVIEWNGRPATAWMPDPLLSRSFDLAVDVARATEHSAAAVRRLGDRLPSSWEALARLLLRAEGVASSNIEGLRVPAAEIAAAELETSGARTDAGWVADNLAVVSDALDHAHTERRLTIDDLHVWHRRLMRHGHLSPDLVGRFRDRQGWIGGRSPHDAVYVPPPESSVPALMNDLLSFTNSTTLDAASQSAVVHAQFETIHPYGDGNGRVGRLLVLWVLARRLEVAVPPPMSVLIARDPGGYLSGLHWFRVGEPSRWISWFAHIIDASTSAAHAWADEVESLMSDWGSRLDDLRSDSAAHAILRVLPAHPVLTAETAARFVGVSDTAARAALRLLQSRGILEPLDLAQRRAGRPRRRWTASALLDVIRV